MSSSPAGLSVRGLHVSLAGDRPATVLRDVDFEVASGEVAVLAGRSGAGKTTFARAVLGVLVGDHAVRGTVHVRGAELWRTGGRPRRELLGHQIALVPPDPFAALHPAVRVERLVAEPLVVRGGMGRAAARRQARALIEEVGLDPAEVGSRLPHELSGGMCQRVLIARTLALDPQVVVADEPVSALDEEARALVTDLLIERTRGRGGSLVLITHHLGEVAARADCFFVLEDGSVRAVPPPEPEPEETPAEDLSSGGVVLRATGVRVERTGRRRDTDRLVIDGVDLTVHSGETLAVIGPSGAGKTTLLRAVAGLVPLSGGHVDVLGRPLDALGARELRRLRRRVRLVHQDPAGALDPRWTVHRLVREPLDIHQIGDRRERDERVAEVLDAVALGPEHAHARPGELSTGQRQRVVLARAVVTQPELLLADEPTAALDAGTEEQVLDFLRRRCAEGMALVITSHHRRVIRGIADRVMTLGGVDGPS